MDGRREGVRVSRSDLFLKYGGVSGGSGRLSRLSGLDQKAVLEGQAMENGGDQMRRVDLVPTLLGGLDELERHGQGGGS